MKNTVNALKEWMKRMADLLLVFLMDLLAALGLAATVYAQL